MGKLISASLDLAKITKDRIKVTDKGQKFLNIDIWINDEPNQYGQNVSINEQQTKDERDRKDKKNYIGNGKTMDQTASKPANVTASRPKHNEQTDGLPF